MVSVGFEFCCLMVWGVALQLFGLGGMLWVWVVFVFRWLGVFLLFVGLEVSILAFNSVDMNGSLFVGLGWVCLVIVDFVGGLFCVWGCLLFVAGCFGLPVCMCWLLLVCGGLRLIACC